MAVIAVIAVLVTLTVGVTRGVQERSRIGRAKSELAALAAALENFKLHHGDYPWTPASPPAGITEGGEILFNALVGNLGPRADAALATKNRTFIETSRFVLASNAGGDQPDPTATTLRANRFVDPWGESYYYHYRKSAADAVWGNPSFLLYSHGPDGACSIGSAANTGWLADVPADEENLDNLYAGRN